MNRSYNNNKYLKNFEDSEDKSRQKPSHLSKCLVHLQKDWHKNKNIASLWQDWPKIAGNKLASNCKPITFQQGILTIGASHPQWIQALMFNRNQLLAALRAEGHEIKELRIKQHYPKQIQTNQAEKDIWDEHPSRADIHGKQICPICNSPSPKGEIALWGKCGLCRRLDFSKSTKS